MKRSLWLLALAVVVVGCGKDKDKEQDKDKAPPPAKQAVAPATPPAKQAVAPAAPNVDAAAGLPELGKELVTIKGASIKRTEPPADGSSSIGWESGKVEVRNRTVRDIAVYAAPTKLVVEDTPLPSGNYNADFTAADDQFWPVVKAAVEQAFGVRLDVAKREKETYVLRAPTGKPAGLKAGDPAKSYASGTSEKGYSFHSADMEHLRAVLQEELKTPVFNETAIEGQYDFDLAGYNHFKPETAIGGVGKLGLELKTEKRAVDCVLVSKAKAAETQKERSTP